MNKGSINDPFNNSYTSETLSPLNLSCPIPLDMSQGSTMELLPDSPQQEDITMATQGSPLENIRSHLPGAVDYDCVTDHMMRRISTPELRQRQMHRSLSLPPITNLHLASIRGVNMPHPQLSHVPLPYQPHSRVYYSPPLPHRAPYSHFVPRPPHQRRKTKKRRQHPRRFNQSTNEPHDQSTNEPHDQSTNEPHVQSTNEPHVQSTNEPHDQSTNEPHVQSTNEPHVQSTNEPHVQTTNEPHVQSTNEPHDQSTNEPHVQSTNEPHVQSTNELPSEYNQSTNEPLIDQSINESHDQSTIILLNRQYHSTNEPSTEHNELFIRSDQLSIEPFIKSTNKLSTTHISRVIPTIVQSSTSDDKNHLITRQSIKSDTILYFPLDL